MDINNSNSTRQINTAVPIAENSFAVSYNNGVIQIFQIQPTKCDLKRSIETDKKNITNMAYINNRLYFSNDNSIYKIGIKLS